MQIPTTTVLEVWGLEEGLREGVEVDRIGRGNSRVNKKNYSCEYKITKLCLPMID
jgi:hypothetical protein